MRLDRAHGKNVSERKNYYDGNLWLHHWREELWKLRENSEENERKYVKMREKIDDNIFSRKINGENWEENVENWVFYIFM